MFWRLLLTFLILSIFCSCNRVPEEFYQLEKIELNYFDLIFQNSDTTYYPASYDKNRSNEFCLLTINFNFEYIDSTESDCPLSPGCAGPRDQILEIFFPTELLELDSEKEHLIILDELTHPLPYDSNILHKKMEENNPNYRFLSHISEILKIKDTYNSYEQNNNELLTFDEFYYMKKSTLANYLLSHGIPKLEVTTTLKRLD